MNRKRMLRWVALALVGVALLAWAFRPAPIQVEGALVTEGPFIQTIDEDGVTRVRDRYIVSAPVSGTLLRPNLDPGDTVTKDAEIAVIVPRAPDMHDPRTRRELIARRDATEARLARARAVVRQTEAELQQAELDTKRREELAKQGFVSATELEQARLRLDVLRKSLDAARFEADAALHDVEQARAAVGRFDNTARGDTDAASAWIVRAPVSGRVLRVLVESGGPVSIGTPIAEIADVSRLEAVIDVLSSDATRIPPNAPVTLYAGEGVRLTGNVQYIEPAAHTRISALGVEEQRVNVIVYLLPNPFRNSLVGDGYRVDAQIEVLRIENAVQVPVSALFRVGSQWAVFVISDGRVQRRNVEIGPRNASYAVVHSGVRTGERVVVYPSDSLTDGRRVK